MITGMVWALGVPVRIRAKMNSFQLTREAEDAGGDDAGPGHRHDDLPDRLHPSAAVDQGRFFQVRRHALEIALHDPGRERQDQAAIGDHQRGAGVDQVEGPETMKNGRISARLGVIRVIIKAQSEPLITRLLPWRA